MHTNKFSLTNFLWQVLFARVKRKNLSQILKISNATLYRYSTSHVGLKFAIKMGVTVLVFVVYCWRIQCLIAFSGNNRAKPICSIFPLQIEISWISWLYTYVQSSVSYKACPKSFKFTGHSKRRRCRRQLDVRSSTINGFFRRISLNCAKSDHTFCQVFFILRWEHCPDWIYTIKDGDHRAR